MKLQCTHEMSICLVFCACQACIKCAIVVNAKVSFDMEDGRLLALLVLFFLHGVQVCPSAIFIVFMQNLNVTRNSSGWHFRRIRF